MEQATIAEQGTRDFQFGKLPAKMAPGKNEKKRPSNSRNSDSYIYIVFVRVKKITSDVIISANSFWLTQHVE